MMIRLSKVNTLITVQTHRIYNVKLVSEANISSRCYYQLLTHTAVRTIALFFLLRCDAPLSCAYNSFLYSKLHFYTEARLIWLFDKEANRE